jgi:hypothetical protein
MPVFSQRGEEEGESLAPPPEKGKRQYKVYVVSTFRMSIDQISPLFFRSHLLWPSVLFAISTTP